MEPKWDKCHFDFVIKGYHEEIVMDVFDKMPFQNRHIGECKLSIDYLIKNSGNPEAHEIYHDKKSAGKVTLVATWVGVEVEEVKQPEKKLEGAMSRMSIGQQSAIVHKNNANEELKLDVFAQQR